MTASKYCKQEGLTSLRELVEISGFEERSLFNMFNDYYKRFVCVVAGAVSIKNKKKCSECKNRQEHENIYCLCICKYNVDITRNNTDRSLFEEGK